ncbi:hypothetical protein Nepgr_010634 [Nepenthes gracilis]|uniref:Beta-glucosidase 11-like n=1 Tax=Nepenthes gracilis TaxID=150966 RepID=A0AAD3SDR1_NEPGR|nr:hypothetical protein Nepgr_010634 [Nepenthes gracilis]
MVRVLTALSLVLLSLNSIEIAGKVVGAEKYSRHDFPADFVFGSGTSAYQVEGAANEDGRTPTIFDTFAHSATWLGGNGDVACDQYHKYKEDVQLMVDTGLDAYRFSISWARLIPNGRGPVNPKGLEYYNNLINELVKHGIQPHVTLLHIDLPQALEDEYGGFVNRRIVRDFKAYAEVCFQEFGDRVLHWTTMNEGNIFSVGGYDLGESPPQRCSFPFGLFRCERGNSTTEPYIAAHNILLAHASAAALYKKKYQPKQHGFIGFNLLSLMFLPATNSTADLSASQRANEFFIGWFMDPLVFGDYPEIMKRTAGNRIPKFTKVESRLVKGSFDFIGINHYATGYVQDNPSNLKREPRDFVADMAVKVMINAEDAPPDGFPVMPWGLQFTLEYFKQLYDNPPMYIHENGQRTDRNTTLIDTSRVEYMQVFIESLLDSVRNGSNARGYFSWSFLDVFEIMDGYRSSYGLYYVDLDDPNLTRYPKFSQHWYSAFLKGASIPSDDVIRLGKNSDTLSTVSF